MLNTDNINPFINDIIYKVNDILKSKKNKQNISDYLYLISIGLILKYDKRIEEDLYNLLDKTEIITSYNKITKIAKVFGKDDLFKDDNTKIWTFYDTNLDKYYVCIKDTNKLEGMLFLEMLVKEFNQLLNSIYNNKIIEDGCEIIRSGLCQEYVYDNKIVKIEGNIINEVFNILQSEEIIKLILSLRYENIECDNIRKILESFKIVNVDDYTFTGNNVLVNIFRRLYNIEDFKNMITNVLLNGNINRLKESIDDTLGFDAYKILDYNLTEAYLNFEGSKVSNLKVYDYSLRHCLLRNMINMYIKKNYEN